MSFRPVRRHVIYVVNKRRTRTRTRTS